MDPLLSSVAFLPVVFCGIAACCISIKQSLSNRNEEIMMLKAKLKSLKDEIENDTHQQKQDLADIENYLADKLEEANAELQNDDSLAKPKYGTFPSAIDSGEDKLHALSASLSWIFKTQDETLRLQQQRLSKTQEQKLLLRNKY